MLAQKAGLIVYRVDTRPDGRVHANDHAGGDGTMLRVFTNETKCIYDVEGSQNGVFHVHGHGVAVVDYKQSDPRTIEYTGALFVKVENAVAAVLAKLFSIFVRKTVDRQFDNVLNQPIVLSGLASTAPQKLLGHINDMPEADRTMLAPLAELLRAAATNQTSGATTR